MDENRPKHISLPPKRIFGTDEPAVYAEGQSSSGPQQASRRRPSGRISFSTLRKPSFIERWRGVSDEEAGVATPERPPIPSALQPPGEVYATPLPVLSMVVLSITMLGEFLSANVSAPFILFMVQGFGQFTDEAKVGYWTGILVSMFFLTQFLTSLLWATVAARHGQRIVLFISLFGSAVTCFLFGTSTSLQQAIVIRLMQGIFAGAIGVARGCITSITDQSNEGRAYAILGFCWGFGGVAGAIVGGTFESPATKWPSLFERMPIFIKYPYLLPCAMAASITFTGSILCLFLGPDCGPREGAIRLPLEKTPTIPEEEEATPTASLFEETERQTLYGSLRKKVSAYLTRRGSDAQEGQTSPTPAQPEPVPLQTTPAKINTPRIFSQTSRANGSAYGYGSSYRPRLGSTATQRMSTAMSIRHRRESNAEARQSMVSSGSELNFAQRLLMANENAVTNIADLWVAAAINADNEEVFEDDDEVEMDADEEAVMPEEDELDEGDVFGTVTPANRNHRFSRRNSVPASPSVAKQTSGGRHLPLLGSPRRPSSSARFSTLRHRSSVYSALSPMDEPTPRRYSTAAAPIFSHVGVRTPPAVLEAQQLLAQMDEPSLAPIIEAHRAGQENADAEMLDKEPSLMSQLPTMIIIQYGLLALHSTTHDQVFYLYLVSKYPLGGLNLDAGRFSQLIALMCLAQIAYQFYLYPNIGPPRGRFSHLAMFRIGSLLFIPSYLSVVLYRVMASPTSDGNPILMSALALSTAVRFCGGTFSYTAVSVLLNYMSPPHVVGFANGIAQSIVSLARFMGPIIGGTLWSMSVEDGPEGYALGFVVCAGACALAITHSFFIR